ncbi:MAG: hypothetical protein K8F91_13025, partial [Candidatus Obscuribacterales bacterium]|nr:hypothetical protein [Candidatus Obscuribacterales bacterium]
EQHSSEGKLNSVGVQWSFRDSPFPVVEAILENSSANEKGVAVGSQILAIDSIPADRLNDFDILNILTGTAGEKVEVTFSDSTNIEPKTVFLQYQPVSKEEISGRVFYAVINQLNLQRMVSPIQLPYRLRYQVCKAPRVVIVTETERPEPDEKAIQSLVDLYQNMLPAICNMELHHPSIVKAFGVIECAKSSFGKSQFSTSIQDRTTPFYIFFSDGGFIGLVESNDILEAPVNTVWFEPAIRRLYKNFDIMLRSLPNRPIGSDGAEK